MYSRFKSHESAQWGQRPTLVKAGACIYSCFGIGVRADLQNQLLSRNS